MTTVLVCLLLTVLMPIVLALIGGYHKTQQLGTVDNNSPRAQSTLLTGAGARTVAAQANSWEALAMFTAAVAAGFFAGVAPGAMALPAVIFVAARIGHAACYLADLATARSAVFGVGTIACLWIFGMALRA